MPLRPEIRPLYGEAWRRFRERFALTHPPICARCDQPHPMMNLAHIRHDAGRRDALAVIWLCPHCHGKHDTPRRLAVTRRAHKIGQLWLSAELELAAFHWWEIAPEVNAAALRNALQEGLPL